MNDSPPPFEIYDDGSVYRFTLPKRKLGDLRRFAWAPLAMGVFGLVFISLWIAMPLTEGLKLVQQGQPFGWLFAAFGLLGLLSLIHI